MRISPNPTQKQMAERLGVSQALVSRALSGRAGEIGASGETVERIRRMAAEWNYQPSATALALLGASTRTVGVVVKNFDDPYFGSLIGALQALARANRYSLLLTGPGGDDISGLQRHRVDAVIFAGSDFPPKVPPAMERAIQIGTGKVLPGALQIQMDEAAGIDGIVDYLAGLGHREIGFVASREGSNQRRAALLRNSLRSRNLPARDKSFFVVPGNHGDGAESVVQKLSGLSRMPTALLAAEDSIALSLLRIFHGAGLRVPGDLSIVGIDDIPASCQAFPPLTTLRQPIGEMASAAFSAVLGRLRKSVSIPGKLIVRESCGPVRPDTPIPRI
jgi:LacI family transcriptional regulator